MFEVGALLALNEIATFFTLWIIFPFILFDKPLSYRETIITVLLFILFSLVWWLYLILSPAIFFVLWLTEDWTCKKHFNEMLNR